MGILKMLLQLDAFFKKGIERLGLGEWGKVDINQEILNKGTN